MKVTMSWSNIDRQGKANVNHALNSGWLSRRKFMPAFEKKMAKLHGAKIGIMTNSGTDAIRIGLMTLKEIYKWRNGDEIIIPGLTFVATANAVLQCGLKPVFADVHITTGNIAPEKIVSRLTRLTRAVLAVHLFGLPASMPALTRITKKHGLKLLEDSCETVGVHKLASDMAFFSFFQSHHVQCGVGGMIVTNNPKYESVARSYMNHGRIDDGTHFAFGRIGYSSRATEMEAGLGLAHLSRIDKDLQVRRWIANLYNNRLLFVSEIAIPDLSHNHSWMFYPIVVLGRKRKRDELLLHLRLNGIESREAMPLINQPCYAGMYKRGSCPIAEYWTENGLLLPLHPLMERSDVDLVTKVVREFFNR